MTRLRTASFASHKKLALVAASVAMASLSLVTAARAATGPGTLFVTTTPDGITLIAPTCYTVTWGTCGVTSWSSTDIEGIPPTTYTFPLTAVAGGLHYVLVTGHFTGCNLGTPGTSGNQCRVSVERGGMGEIHATYRLVPLAPVPPCASGAPNLVLNPSFESVSGAGIYTGSTNPLETWWYISTPATTMVPHWTRDNTNEAIVFNAGTINGVTQLAASGQRFVGMGFADTTNPSGIRGVVTPAPTVGTTYVLSAKVQSVDWPTAGVVSLRLANSGSGAHSALIYTTSAPQSTGWTLVGGAVVATGYYNQVIVHYVQGGGAARVDDVHVCRAASANRRRAPVATTTTTTSSSTPLVYGQPVTFSASVAVKPTSSPPTGVVQFLVNGKIVATSSLSNGRASATLDSSQWPWINQASIAAVYSGDPSHASSTARPITLKVPAPTTVTTTSTSSTTTSTTSTTTSTTSTTTSTTSTTTSTTSTTMPTTSTTSSMGGAGSPLG